MRLAQFVNARHAALMAAVDRGGLEGQVAAVALSSVAGLPLRTIAGDCGLSITAVICIVGVWAVAVSDLEAAAPAYGAEARFA